MTSMFEVQPSKTRPKYQSKQGAPFGFQDYNMSLQGFPINQSGFHGMSFTGFGSNSCSNAFLPLFGLSFFMMSCWAQLFVRMHAFCHRLRTCLWPTCLLFLIPIMQTCTKVRKPDIMISHKSLQKPWMSQTHQLVILFFCLTLMCFCWVSHFIKHGIASSFESILMIRCQN